MLQVRDQLTALGATDAEIKAAEADASLHLLALELTLFPRTRRYTLDEAAAVAGLDPVVVRRIRRTIGLTDVAPDQVFTEADVDAMRIMAHLLEGFDLDATLQLYRVAGAAMARIAESEVGFVGSALAAFNAGAEPTDEEMVLAAAAIPQLVRDRMPQISDLLHYAHMQHLVAAARREVLWQSGVRSGVENATVGFCDLVGYTAWSEGVDPVALAALVDRFEARTYDVVSEQGGRVVKTIGDEIMYRTDDLVAAVEIGLTLTEVFAGDETLRNVRAGVATGQVLSRDGDIFGPVVNLASRLTGRAYPSTVLASEDVHAGLAGTPEAERYVWAPLRARHLKGIGTVRAWAVRRHRHGTAAGAVRQTRRPAPPPLPRGT